MANFSVKMETTGIKRRFKAILKSLPASLKSGLRDWAVQTIKAIKARNMGPPGTIRRSGHLNASWDHKESGQSIGDVELSMFNTAIYSRVQELGKTIRPVKAGALAIPLMAALNSRGSKKWPSPSAQGGLWMITSKAGQGFLVGQNEKRSAGNLIAYWILKKSVYIPPRMGAHETVGQRRAILIESLGDKVAAMLNRG